MPMVQVVSEVKVDLNQLLDGIAQLDLPELERFSFKVSNLVAQRKSPYLPQRESELLQQINLSLPAEKRQRYAELNAKLLDETITLAENQELGELIEKIEQADVERLQALVELAQLRNMSLARLMEQIGVSRSPHV
jgi:hypothetical protein